MYKLMVKSEFDAAHKLDDYEGLCSKLHGHTWKIEVFVVGKKLDDIGILMDFEIIKEKLEDIVKKFDHSYLNDFKEIGNPTSENISRYIFKNLRIPSNSAKLEKVRVWENQKNWCEYYE